MKKAAQSVERRVTVELSELVVNLSCSTTHLKRCWKHGPGVSIYLVNRMTKQQSENAKGKQTLAPTGESLVPKRFQTI